MTILNTTTCGQGDDLVLLHGWGSHSGVWHTFADELAKRYRLTLIDLPGHGGSNVIEGGDDLNTVVDAVLQAAPEHAHWLGWSLGGMLTWAAALRAPDRVASITTLASSPKFISDDNWVGTDLATLGGFGRALQEDPQQTLTGFIALQLLGVENAAQLGKTLKKRLFETENASDPQGLIHGLSLLKDIDLRNGLKDITCPQLNIFGRLDNIVPEGTAEQLRTIHPNAHIVTFEHDAHIPFLSSPEKTLALVHKHLC